MKIALFVLQNKLINSQLLEYNSIIMVTSRCPKCRTQKELILTKKGTTTRGMDYLLGKCETCGTNMTRFLPKQKVNQSESSEFDLRKSSLVDLDTSEESE
jgi:uncharacterized Zn finger protein